MTHNPLKLPSLFHMRWKGYPPQQRATSLVSVADFYCQASPEHMLTKMVDLNSLLLLRTIDSVCIWTTVSISVPSLTPPAFSGYPKVTQLKCINAANTCGLLPTSWTFYNNKERAMLETGPALPLEKLPMQVQWCEEEKVLSLCSTDRRMILILWFLLSPWPQKTQQRQEEAEHHTSQE